MILLKEYDINDWIEIDDAVEPFSPPRPPENFAEMTKNSIAVTGIEDGNVMACGGITYTSSDEAVIWVKVSRKCLKHPYKWAKSIRDAFKIIRESIGDIKLYTYVLDNFCKGEKMARLIGLIKSDQMEKYKGRTYYKWQTL